MFIFNYESTHTAGSEEDMQQKREEWNRIFDEMSETGENWIAIDTASLKTLNNMSDQAAKMLRKACVVKELKAEI